MFEQFLNKTVIVKTVDVKNTKGTLESVCEDWIVVRDWKTNLPITINAEYVICISLA